MNRITQKCIWSTLFAVSSILGLVAHGEPEPLDGIAAIVNDDVVMISELQQRYENFLLQAEGAGVTDLPPRNVVLSQILERLILESIQMQEAELRGLVISDEELTSAVRSFAENNGMNIDDFRASLEEQNISYKAFRADVKRQMILTRIQQALVNRRIFISEQDIKDFRDSPFFALLASDEFRVGHILLSVDDSSQNAVAAAKERADYIVTELRGGADFATMAVKNSSASTALEGGDLGWRATDQLPSLFGEAVLEMEIGDVADPIRNSLGFHIVKLLDKRGASTQSGERTNVRHILVRPSTIKSDEEAREEIQFVFDTLTEGGDFSELAAEHSDDVGTALTGGDLGWTDGENLDPDFRATMDATEPGNLSEPFESSFGWHVLEVLDRRVEDLSEEALDDLAFRSLHNRRYDEALQEWLKEIRDEAFVKIVSESS